MFGRSRERSGRGTFEGGVHPPSGKALAAGRAIEVLPVPERVLVPLQQHIGGACSPTVEAKDRVQRGQKLGESEAFVSAPVHSPVNGTAERARGVLLPNGVRTGAVPVSAEGVGRVDGGLMEELFGGSWEYGRVESYAAEEIAARVREAGIVGMGGATFPTHVKLTSGREKGVDTVVVNGCECEPYLTADDRLMREAPAAVVWGGLAAARACGAERVLVAVEDNKPDAFEALRVASEGTGVRVVEVETKYPMGGERELVPAVTGRVIPAGGLPLDVGVVVVNVGTCAAIAGAVLRGLPLTHRVVTVTGRGIKRPANILAPIGAPVRTLLDFCGGLKASAARVVAGGPMMGFAVGDLDTPVTKGTSGLVVLDEEDVRREEETECVRCARCVDVCPMRLVPTKIALASRNGLWERAEELHAVDCIECGCCAYVCPARIPLVQLIRVAKGRILERRRAERSGQQAGATKA